MYNLLLSAAAGIVVAVVIRLLNFGLVAALVPGTLAFLGAYVVLARRIANKVQLLVTAAQKELSTQPANQREKQQRIDKAIKILEEGLAFDKWQFLVGSELHAQIGMIQYAMQNLDAAQKHLSKANSRNYMALAMQGALYFQRKAYDDMKRAFEQAVKSGKKESIVWAVYAYCLLQLKDKDGALRVMAQAVELNPSDEKLKAGLTALQNDKKLKMKPYEPMWWQFGLEQPPMQMATGRRVQFERR